MAFPTINIDIVAVAVIVLVFYLVIRFFSTHAPDRWTDAEYEKKVSELEHRVDFLLSELQRAGVRIHELEQRTAPPPLQEVLPLFPAKPLLLICGTDTMICEADRHALRSAAIGFTRLVEVTKKQIEDELQRQRSNDSLYRWIHVAAHATVEGIYLADGVAAPDWWQGVLHGIEVVLLAACKSASVADSLAGMVTVVYILDDVENRDASKFTYAFWRRMKQHNDPVIAYRQAINEVPNMSEITDIRRA